MIYRHLSVDNTKANCVTEIIIFIITSVMYI